MTEEEFKSLQNKLLAELAENRTNSEQIQNELSELKTEAIRAKSMATIRAEQAREYLNPVELVSGMQSLLYEADGSDSEHLAILQFKLNVYKELLKKVLPDLKALEVKTEGARGDSLFIDFSEVPKPADLDGEKVIN